jgi:predicted tellurium resistance membrane protein TerC
MLPPTITTKIKIKRFEPLQLGKMLALLHGMIGLIFLPIVLFFSLIASKLPPTQRVGVMAMGIGFMLFMPIMYAVMGFLVGVTSGWLYNLFAKWIGGIEVEIK